jgi:hypothetical protein
VFPRYNSTQILLMKTISFLLLIVLILPSLHCRKKAPLDLTRSFNMAVTPWPADFTPAAVDDAYAFINQHCDMVSHHFDEGIPYEEADHHAPWPQHLVDDVTARRLKTAPGKKILLSVAALNLTRHEKADYYQSSTGISDSIKNYWKQLPFNDPKIVNAYIAYITYLVDQLHPQMVNYGVESNDTRWDPVRFNEYKSFLSQVYSSLKTKYPNLPFFVSLMVQEDPKALTLSSQLLPLTDYITLSAYPYAGASSTADGTTDPKKMPADYFTRFIDLDPSKPWGFAETGYIAQDLSIPSYSLNRQGTAAWQNDYLNLVFDLMNKRKGKFLVWFCFMDYDAGSNTLKQMGLYQDLFGLWQDIGLKDEHNLPRPAYDTWLRWMQYPVK